MLYKYYVGSNTVETLYIEIGDSQYRPATLLSKMVEPAIMDVKRDKVLIIVVMQSQDNNPNSTI